MIAGTRRPTEVRSLTEDRFVVCARRGFKKYGVKKEDRSRVGSPVVERDEVLEKLEAFWNGWEYGGSSLFGDQTNYEIAVMFVKGLDYSPVDVEAISIALLKYQGEEFFWYKASDLLNALVNHGQDKRYTIHTEHLDKVPCVGKNNTKIVIVRGNTGMGTGRGMERGYLHIYGKSDMGVGSNLKGGKIIVEEGVPDGCDGIGNDMEGGELIVKGKINGAVGWGLRGGVIRVFGDITGAYVCWGKVVGNGMTGGEIHMYGTYPDIGDVLGGRIFHNGVLIAGKI